MREVAVHSPGTDEYGTERPRSTKHMERYARKMRRVTFSRGPPCVLGGLRVKPYFATREHWRGSGRRVRCERHSGEAHARRTDRDRPA